MSADNLKEKTISSLFWKLFEQGGAATITLIIQIVMARILSPEEFGALAIMLVFVNVGNIVVQSGLNTAVIQAPDVTERDYSTVFWMSLAVSILLYGVVFVFAPMVADFYAMPSIVEPLRVLTLILVVNAYNSIQEAIVARTLSFRITFRATVTAGVLSGALGVFTAISGGGIWALVVQQLLFQLCKCVVLASQLTWKPQFLFDCHRASVLYKFGWKLLASGLLDQGYQSLSDLIVGKLFTKSDLGFVSQGKKYPQALGTTLDGAIQPVMLSAVSHVQDDRARVRRLVRRALKTSTFFIVPAMTLFAIAAEPLVVLLLGEKWLPCVPFLQLYCFIYALLPIHSTNLQALNGMGRSDLFFKLEIVKKVIGLAILCFSAFVLKDLYAIVMGYVLNGIICTFVNASPNKLVIGYDYISQVRDICPAFGLSFLGALASLPITALGFAPLITVLLQAVIMMAVYIAAAHLFRVEEMAYLVRTIRGRINNAAR